MTIWPMYFQNLARVTGSRAFEHCTGPQIMEIFQNKRQDYDNTEVRDSLVFTYIRTGRGSLVGTDAT